MLMSWIWAAMVLLSVIAAGVLGKGSELSAAVLDGAQSGVTLIIGMSGAICLWSGVGKVMDRSGITDLLARLLKPGIQAAQRMANTGTPGVASDQLCRLIVLNTASIQLIPTSVAAVRLAAGCTTPFDILPAVWLTSLCSAALGLTSAWIMGKAVEACLIIWFPACCWVFAPSPLGNGMIPTL